MDVCKEAVEESATRAIVLGSLCCGTKEKKEKKEKKKKKKKKRFSAHIRSFIRPFPKTPAL